MNEEEKAIEIIQDLIKHTKENVKYNIENLSEYRITNRVLGYRALEIILGLYNKEKEKNEELKKQISELQSKVDKIENENKKEKKQENKKGIKRWRAKIHDSYFYINDFGYADSCHETNAEVDNYRYKIRNYFKTEEETEEYQDIINTYYDLMDLAEELNNGEKIDWYDNRQQKFYISFDFKTNKLDEGYIYRFKEIGQIYCLDENFQEKAIEKIGEDKLTKLFKYERS